MSLSKRDKLLLAMSALTELDEREGGRRNDINFSGSILTSNNMDYVVEYCEQMFEWSEPQLLEFAFQWLEQLRNEG